jgi:hypothetical protein
MSELYRWETAEGSVVVEVGSGEPGFEGVSRKAGEIIHDVGRRFDDALDGVRGAARSALLKFRDVDLRPDEVEIELGVSLNAAAGAVIARTCAEGHMIVRLRWSGAGSDDDGDGGGGNETLAEPAAAGKE